MTITINPPITRPTGPRYDRSFASYEIPFRPDDPAEFVDTAGLASFYVASHDPAGRVIQFDKLRLVRVGNPTRTLELTAPDKPGASVYFKVIRDSAGREPDVGEQIDYQDTEHLQEFFAGNVARSGQTCQASLFRREIAFSEAYEYWPNGRLRKRAMTGPDQAPAVAHYDRNGRLLPEPAKSKKGGGARKRRLSVDSG